MFKTHRYYYIFPIVFILTVLILLFNEYSKEKTHTVRWTQNFEATFVLSDLDKKTFISPNELPSMGLQPQVATIRIFSLTFTIKKHSISAENDTLFLKKIIPLEHNSGFFLLLSDKKNNSINMNVSTNKHKDIEEYIITIKNHSNVNTKIPFSFDIGSNTVMSKKQIEIVSKFFRAYLSVSPNIELKKHSFILHSSNGIIRISNQTNQQPFNKVSFDPAMFNTITVNLDAVLQEYLDKSYYAWIFSRYQKSTGSWRYPQSIHAFNEDVLLATYAEAISRKELARYKLLLERTANMYENNLTWKSFPILGINNKSIEDTIRIPPVFNSPFEEYEALFKTFLLDPSFLEYAYLFYPQNIQNIIFQSLASFSFTSCSPELAISLLYQSRVSSWEQINSLIQSNKDVLETIVLNNFVAIESNNNNFSLHSENFLHNIDTVLFLLSNSNNQLDSMATIVAAKYFMSQSNNMRIKFGEKLVHDLLLQSDHEGFFPRWFSINVETVTASGYIAPETIYTLLTHSDYYPKIFIEDDLRILSISPVRYTYANKRLRLNATTIAPNISSYLYVWNKEAPIQIEAFDVLWKGNYNLDGLLRGVQYNASTNTILIKLRSKNVQEQFSIYY